MRHCSSAALLVFLLFPTGLWAQNAGDAQGIRWGGGYIQPEASVVAAYDDRVLLNGDYTSDFYTEVAAAVALNNLPARYDLSAQARYGYRFYSENIDRNDDFYSAGAAVSTDQNPFQWGLSADVTKSLNYSTFYDPSSGEGPDSILTDSPNRRFIARGDLAYEKQLTEKTSIMPGYEVTHYFQEFQEFQDSKSAEWQVHSASVQLRHAYSTKMRFTVTGDYSLQVNDVEKGYIGKVEFGAESSISDKVSWRASVGVAVADYEISGSDQSGILNLQTTWLVTEKVSAYIFAENDFQPSYGDGAARLVYRAGYGADWRLSRRWALGGTVLHDYEQEIGSGDGSTYYGGVRHFFSAQCSYSITTKLLLSLTGAYIKDGQPMDQTVISARLSYAY